MIKFTESELRQTLEKHSIWLFKQPQVVGHGVGIDKDGRMVIKIFVNGLSKSGLEEIEKKFDGVPVVFEDHGPIILHTQF